MRIPANPTKISAIHLSLGEEGESRRRKEKNVNGEERLTSRVVNMFGFDRQFRSHPTMGKYFNDKTFSFRFDLDGPEKKNISKNPGELTKNGGDVKGVLLRT